MLDFIKEKISSVFDIAIDEMHCVTEKVLKTLYYIRLYMCIEIFFKLTLLGLLLLLIIQIS